MGEQVPHVPAQPHGVPAPAGVGGDCDRGVRPGDRPPGLDGDERLVAEADHDGIGTERIGRLDAPAQRRDLALGPAVVHHVHDGRVERGAQLSGRHDDDRTDAGGQGGLDRPGDDGAAVEGGVELVRRPAEAAAGTGGEDDGDDGSHPTSLAARWVPAGASVPEPGTG